MWEYSNYISIGGWSIPSDIHFSLYSPTELTVLPSTKMFLKRHTKFHLRPSSADAKEDCFDPTKMFELGSFWVKDMRYIPPKEFQYSASKGSLGEQSQRAMNLAPNPERPVLRWAMSSAFAIVAVIGVVLIVKTLLSLRGK
jgi:hypothetical protein